MHGLLTAMASAGLRLLILIHSTRTLVFIRVVSCAPMLTVFVGIIGSVYFVENSFCCRPLPYALAGITIVVVIFSCVVSET